MAILKDLIVNGASRFIGDAYFNTIKAGVWNGTAIDVAHGGTGLTSLSSGYLLEGNTSSLMQARKITDSITSGSSYIPTSGAVYSAISAGFAANGAMVFKGTYTAQASSSSTVVTSGFSTAPGSASLGWTWIVTGNNTYFGNIVVEAGDMIISKVSNPGTTISNYYVIQTNIDVTHYVTTNTAQTITGAKTFNAETTFNKLATFNKGLTIASIGDSDNDVLSVSGSSSFNDIVNINGLTNHGNHVIPTDTNSYDLGSSSLKWRNIYATTFTGSLSGNASSASKLTTVSKKIWGQTYWTSDGVPTDVTGVISNSNGFKISTVTSNLTSGSLGGSNYNSFRVSNESYGLYTWIRSNGRSYIQGGRLDGTATNYDIILQALGANVGIGEETPSEKLHVNGNIKATSFIGNATSASKVSTVTSSTNANYYLTFVDSNNSSATAESVYTNSGLYYNPNSNTLTANVFYGSLAGNASLSLMLSSHYGILGSTNNAQGHWFKFATLSFNNTAWDPFDEWLFFGSTENTTYCPNGILRISGRQSSNLGYAAQFEIYWISLGNIWYRDKVVAIKTANCVFDLYISNYGTYESICIYRMANSGTYQRLVFNSDNNRSWIATLPTPAAATVNGEKTTVTSSLAGYSYSADKLTTSRTLTIGNSSKTFDGSGNISWTLSDIGAASSSSLGNYLPLDGGTMSGIISWNGATQEILRFANNNSTWYSGLKYSWSSNTTVALWGKNKNTQFVWNTGSDYTSTDINGTSNRNYDFQVGRNTSTDKVEVRTNGSMYSYGYHHLTLDSDNYVLLAGGGYKAYGNASDKIPVSNGTLNTNLNADLLDGYHALGITNTEKYLIKQAFISPGADANNDHWYRIATIQHVGANNYKVLLYISTNYPNRQSALVEIAYRTNNGVEICEITGYVGTIPAANIRLYYDTTNYTTVPAELCIFIAKSSTGSRTVNTRVISEVQRDTQFPNIITLDNNVLVEASLSSYTTMTYANFLGNASALTTDAGSSKIPVYFSGGKPVSTGYDLSTFVKKTGDSMSGTLTILTLNINKSSPTVLQLVINGPTYDANMDVSSLKAWPGIGFHMPNRTYASLIYDGKFKAVSSNFTDYLYFFGAGFLKSGSSDEYVLLGGGGHKAISDFATSGHNHNSSYVSSVAISGNYLRITKNGSNSDLTIPYAETAGNLTLLCHSSNYLLANKWHKIAYTGETTGNTYKWAIIVIEKVYNKLTFGILRIWQRRQGDGLNNLNSNEHGAVWLARAHGLSTDMVKICTNNDETKMNSDLYIKFSSWMYTRIYCIYNNGWNFLDTLEAGTGSYANITEKNVYASIPSYTFDTYNTSTNAIVHNDGVKNSEDSSVVNTAHKLSTVSKTAWGLTYWTSDGVPTTISGDMSSVGNITPSNNASKTNGTSGANWATVYTRAITSGDNLTLSSASNKDIIFNTNTIINNSGDIILKNISGAATPSIVFQRGNLLGTDMAHDWRIYSNSGLLLFENNYDNSVSPYEMDEWKPKVKFDYFGNIEASKFIGSLNYSFTLTLNGGSTEGTNKFTFNNSSSKSVSIYAPTSAGSLNLILVANSSGIPTWLTGYPVIDCYHSSNSDINSGLWDQVKKVSSPMKVHFYDVYNDGGPTTYGNMMEIVGRSGHWQPLLWFDAGTTGSVRHRNINYNSTDWGSWYLFSDSANSSLSTSSNVVSLKLLNSTASVYNTDYIDNLSLYANKSTTTSSITLVPTEWKQLCQLSATTLLSSNYGTYVVQITKGTGSSFVFIGSGIMSYGSTNSSALEEIVLHCYGGDDNRLYLGTQNGYLMGAAKVSLSAAQYTITFKRII